MIIDSQIINLYRRSSYGPLGFQLGGKDTFLAKFNKDGERLWIRQFGVKGNDFGVDLAIDSNNRIYVLSDEGADNFAIRKFNTEGTLLKTRSVTSASRPDLTPKAIAIDSLNKLIILTDWNNSAGGRGRDVRLFKYNSNLNLVWQKGHSTTNNDHAYDVTTDSNNNIYFTISGHFVKKNAAGATRYSRRYSTTSSTTPTSITNDSDDNIYIAGHTYGSFPTFTNAGNADIVVFKYNSGGTQQWISQFDTNNYGSANADEARDVVVNEAVYITGITRGNLLTGSATSYGGSDNNSNKEPLLL